MIPFLFNLTFNTYNNTLEIVLFYMKYVLQVTNQYLSWGHTFTILLPILEEPFTMEIYKKSKCDPMHRDWKFKRLLRYVKTIFNHDNNQILFRKR